MNRIIGEELESIPFEENESDEYIWRYSKNPIIKRNPIKNVARIFNSAIVRYNYKFIGIFRGDTNTTVPYLYYGESSDGINFKFNDDKIRFFNEDGSEYHLEYAYDPRITKIDDEFIITWCDGMNGQPTIGLAKTYDFKKFVFLGHSFLPYNRNGVLFPKKINGEYAMLSRPSDNGHTQFGDIYISYSKDLIYWGKHKQVMRPRGEFWWESTKIGAGPVPILTSEGWLLFYHGVTKTAGGLVYSMGAAILDEDDPTIVKYRAIPYVLTPEKEYETTGFVNNVIFPCSALSDSKTGKIAIYYGSADSYVSLAFTTVDKIIKFIKENS